MITKLKNNADFDNYLTQCQNRITTFLTHILPSSQLIPKRFHEAMRYCVLNGGKRVRPLLVYATGEALGANLSALNYPASAIELIHCYSLVHDDLPAMDNDDLRRGILTCHKAFDEATAILVGDALQTLSFDILSRATGYWPEATQLKMINLLAKASGSLGMAGGQALDLQATGNQLTIEEIKHIHQHKTGALIAAAIQLGILASPPTHTTVINALQQFAELIGLCFQIKDDILNQESSAEALGKNVGTDQANQKATFATIMSIAAAKQLLSDYYEKALSLLAPHKNQLNRLISLAEYIVMRDK